MNDQNIGIFPPIHGRIEEATTGNLVPMVVEQTNQGERARHLFSLTQREDYISKRSN